VAVATATFELDDTERTALGALSATLAGITHYSITRNMDNSSTWSITGSAIVVRY